MMKAALGISTQDKPISPSEGSLLQILTDLKHEIRQLEVPYCFAAARRRKIVEGAKNLIEVLGISSVELHLDIKLLLQHDNDNTSKTHSESQKVQNAATNENKLLTDALPAKSLGTDFLTRCEDHISRLRIAKSEKLLRSRELQQKITELIGEMHLNYSQSLQLIQGWIKKNGPSHLPWWDSKFAENLLHDIAQMKSLPSSTGNLSQHLELIDKALTSSADSRRSMSEALKSVIEHAQKTLLDIVGREIDASEAYTGFHDALFRMPPLSKDLILSCISELEALIDGTEAMTQSETEALTVVWEALKISQKDRMNFWGILEKSGSNSGVKNDHLFFEKFSGTAASSNEEWMVEAAASAGNFNHILEKRLKKLEGINNEVERLRSKQDMKSRILSLDSEIRIMNTKLLEFEEVKCAKRRLPTKKNGGAAPLKGERFRKQMKSKFLANLKQLVNLLRSWESRENALFDDSLLSDDVRELLKKGPDQIGNALEMRTNLMPLRTKNALVAKKRSHEGPGSGRRAEKECSRPASRLTPKKRTTPRRGRKDIDFVGKRKVEENTSSGLRKRDGNCNYDERIRSPKMKKRKHASVALPFGTILTDTPTKTRDNI